MVKKVRNIVVAATLVLLAAACQDEEKVVYWESLSVTRDEVGVDADIVYPYRFGGDKMVSENMNNRINEAIVNPLIDNIEQGVNISVDSMLNRIIAEKLSDTVLTRIPYKLISTGSVYAAEKFTSVFLSSYNYMGGANGNSTSTFLNFDNETGELLNIADILVFNDALLDELRKRFCMVREISITASAKQAGMFIAPIDLEYPGEIGFVQEGVVFYYNQYEVGPRVFGKTEVLIPYDRVSLVLSN